MAYEFHGFFAKAQIDVLASAIKQWPKLQGRHITEPFQGIGVRCPDILTCDSNEEAKEVSNIVGLVRKELPDWSSTFPDVVFVYVEAECFGICEYEGYVCQNGTILQREADEGALGRLMLALDVELNQREYFVPFERGFFKQGE